MNRIGQAQNSTPPFATGARSMAVSDHDSPVWRSQGPFRVAARAFLAGLALAVPIGPLVGWLCYLALAADCSNDGWCELGAAVFGLLAAVAAGYLSYVVAGITAIRRFHRPGDRLVPAIVHTIIPLVLVVAWNLSTLLPALLSSSGL